MHILEVEYTAELIKSVAILTGKTTGEVVIQIGAEGVARLMHNAPMNQLLQYGRIVGEIIHDPLSHSKAVYHPDNHTSFPYRRWSAGRQHPASTKDCRRRHRCE